MLRKKRRGSNKVVECYKGGYYQYIYIKNFDEDSIDEYQLLLDFLYKISEDKVIFAEVSDVCTFNPNKILQSLSINNILISDILQLQKLDNETINKKLFENRYVGFSIYQNNVKWEEYLYNIPFKINRELKCGKLYADISLFEGDVIIYCHRENETVKEFLKGLNNQGYKVKGIIRRIKFN